MLFFFLLEAEKSVPLTVQQRGTSASLELGAIKERKEKERKNYREEEGASRIKEKKFCSFKFLL